MHRKRKKLPQTSNDTKRAPTATRDESDAVAVPTTVHAVPNSDQLLAVTDPDLHLATMLLIGFVDCERRRLTNKYLEKGSPEEVEARRAIVRVLRSNRPLRLLRWHLADLFDPDPVSEQRTIEFVFRRQGTPTDHIRNTQIAQYVWGQVKQGDRVTKAINNAANKFALSQSTIKNIWNIYRSRTADLG